MICSVCCMIARPGLFQRMPCFALLCFAHSALHSTRRPEFFLFFFLFLFLLLLLLSLFLALQAPNQALGSFLALVVMDIRSSLRSMCRAYMCSCIHTMYLASSRAPPASIHLTPELLHAR
ncbi:hypothetical protein I7I53_10662 [Histoplasma capsulatum var. duboisii H88]|uniref:Uncharacterized protein n=1 Tax=Ajellomyces capsulatus (strain H88) TaxID=544711 RepID=A0A8A1LE75_AJEC8|nr:hypothetical protein I7I53_10662 [Histoplasma capsulatum var. duboisii H88]